MSSTIHGDVIYTGVVWNPVTGEYDLPAGPTKLWDGVMRYAEDLKPPRHYSRKAKGWLYPKTYSREVVTRSTSPSGWCEARSKDGEVFRLTGPLNVNKPGPDVVSFETLRTRAEMQALAKLKGQKIDLSTALAEYKSTANTFSDGCKLIADATNSFRKGRALSDLWKRTKSGKLASDVLGYLYGVRPVVNDVMGALEELQNRHNTEPVVTVKGIIKEPVEQTIEGEFGSTFGMPTRSVYKGMRGAFVRLDFSTNNNLLASAGRLGVTNPFATAYNLLPYSWAVDWAVPIGSWLNNLDATLGFDFKSGSITLRHDVTCETDAVPSLKDWSIYGWDSVSANFAEHERVFTLNRGVYNQPPFPSLHVRSPVSSESIAVSLALLVQSVTSK